MAECRLPEQLKFNGDSAENFRKFKQQFEIYLVASGKDKEVDTVKVAILLNCMGGKAVDVYNNFKLSSVDRNNFEKVMAEFDTYMNPTKNELYGRYLFYSRNQLEGEAFDEFVADIKKLVKTCNFKEEEKMIRDRIVLGVNNKEVQEKLINMKDLNLENCINYCQISEEIKEQMQEKKNVNVTQKEEFKFNRKYPEKGNFRSSTEEYLCFRCNRKHCYNKCPAYGQKCKRCGIPNHFAACCRVNNVKETSILQL